MSASQPTRVDLGAALRRVRTQRKMTIEQVADRAGAHPTYVSKIERAKNNITWAKLGTIAEALDISIVDIAAIATEERDRRLAAGTGD